MAEVLITETDTDHRYRITETDKGFLLSCAQRGEVGLVIGPSEWLYKTREAAEKGLAFVMLMNAWWRAMTHGYPVGDLPHRCEIASAEHADVVAQLNDQPLVGREVKELRESQDDDRTRQQVTMVLSCLNTPLEGNELVVARMCNIVAHTQTTLRSSRVSMIA